LLLRRYVKISLDVDYVAVMITLYARLICATPRYRDGFAAAHIRLPPDAARYRHARYALASRSAVIFLMLHAADAVYAVEGDLFSRRYADIAMDARRRYAPSLICR